MNTASTHRDAGKAGAWLAAIADPIRLAILRSLSEVSAATIADLAKLSSTTTQTLRRHLEALVSVGVVVQHPGHSDGETPGRPASRFSLAAGVRESVRSVLASPPPSS